MKKQFFAALVFAFCLVFGGVAIAQPAGNAPEGNGNGDGKSPCELLKECEAKKPPPPPPRFKCGEGTVEEGQVLVGKVCSCKEPYRNHLVHDLSSYGTLVCVPKASIWKKFDDLEKRVADDEKALNDLKAEWKAFLEWINGLGLEDFIRATNIHLTRIDVRLDALEKDVAGLKEGQQATNKKVDHLAKSALQLTIGLEGCGNYRTASGEDENGTGKFSAGAGCVLGTVGLQGYFSDIFGLETQFKAGLMSGAHTDGAAGELGGTIGIALRFDPVYLALGPAWYTMVAAHHSDAGGEGNFRGWGMGGQLDVGVRPIPQLELGGTIFAGGGHNGSSEIRVEGAGAWIQGGVFLKGVLGVVDSEDSSK